MSKIVLQDVPTNMFHKIRKFSVTFIIPFSLIISGCTRPAGMVKHWWTLTSRCRMSIFYATNYWLYDYHVLKLCTGETLKKPWRSIKHWEDISFECLLVPFHLLASRMLTKTCNYLTVHENFASKQILEFELTKSSK